MSMNQGSSPTLSAIITTGTFPLPDINVGMMGDRRGGPEAAARSKQAPSG
jgi:hypothetical protein